MLIGSPHHPSPSRSSQLPGSETLVGFWSKNLKSLEPLQCDVVDKKCVDSCSDKSQVRSDLHQNGEISLGSVSSDNDDKLRATSVASRPRIQIRGRPRYRNNRRLWIPGSNLSSGGSRMRSRSRSKSRSQSPCNSPKKRRRSGAFNSNTHFSLSPTIPRDSPSTDKRKAILEFSVVGSADAQGTRAYMEDRNVIIDKIEEKTERPNMQFVGVYDGHGGAACAEHTANFLHRYLFAELAKEEMVVDDSTAGPHKSRQPIEDWTAKVTDNISPSDKILDKDNKDNKDNINIKDINKPVNPQNIESSKSNTSVGENNLDKLSEKSISDILRASFLATDQKWLTKAGTHNPPLRSGSTAVVALLDPGWPSEIKTIDDAFAYVRKTFPESVEQKNREKENRALKEHPIQRNIAPRVFIAHAGDSRAVLCRSGRAQRLTKDHKPNIPAEKDRILRNGGHVIFLGCWRVARTGAPSAMACSRAIGDYSLKRPLLVMTADPDISSLPLQCDDEFLIIATDGLWDVVADQDAIDLVREKMKKSTGGKKDAQSRCTVAAESLVQTALDKGSQDNITCVVVMLQWANENETKQ